MQSGHHPIQNDEALLNAHNGYQPYHEQLPDIITAQKKKPLTDHVAIEGTLTYDNSKGKKITIKVGSQNNLGTNEGNGYGFKESNNMAVDESPDELKTRLDENAKNIAESIELNQYDFYTAQECGCKQTFGNNYLVERVLELLRQKGLSYDCGRTKTPADPKAEITEEMTDIISGGDCVTFYNTKKFRPTYEDNKNTKQDRYNIQLVAAFDEQNIPSHTIQLYLDEKEQAICAFLDKNGVLIKKPLIEIDKRANSRTKYLINQASFSLADDKETITKKIYAFTAKQYGIYQTITQAKDFESSEFAGNIISFTPTDDDETELLLANTHHNFDKNITVHENHIKNFINQADSACLTFPIDESKTTIFIIAGDFNGVNAPLVKTGESQLHNAVTSVSHPSFSEHKIQEAFPWLDFVYYAVRKPGKDKIAKIYNAEVKQIDSNTKQPYPDGTPKIIDKSKLSPKQQEVVERFRLAICLDDHFYKKEKLIHGQFTIFEYEEKLRTEFANQAIYVRRAINLEGQMGFGIIIPENIYRYLASMNINALQLRQDSSFTTGDFFTAYVSDENLHQLTYALNTLKLKTFEEKILALQNSTDEFMRLKGEALEGIYNAIFEEPNNHEDPYPIIIDHFTNMADAIAQGNLTTLKEIEKSCDELNEKLFQVKKPLRPAVKTAIGIGVGLLVGAVIGIGLGLAIAASTGGLGSPMAILIALAAMVKGAEIGGTMALAGGAFFGAFFGTAVSRLHADHHQYQYENKIEAQLKEKPQLAKIHALMPNLFKPASKKPLDPLVETQQEQSKPLSP